jgi:DNA-binding MarR family transcriptional regulator
MSIGQEIKSSVELSLNQKIVINLLKTGSWINECSGDYFKQYDLSMQQYNVLRILRGKKGESANLSYVQERMISPMSNTTRLIEKLRLKGLLTRVLCENNRRKIEIDITDKGLDLLKEIDGTMDAHQESITKNLTMKEIALLNDLLTKIRINKNK